MSDLNNNDIKAQVAISRINTLDRDGNMTSNSDVLCCGKMFSYFAATYLTAISFIKFPSPSKLFVLEVAYRALSFTWLSNNNI